MFDESAFYKYKILHEVLMAYKYVAFLFILLNNFTDSHQFSNFNDLQLLI